MTKMPSFIIGLVVTLIVLTFIYIECINLELETKDRTIDRLQNKIDSDRDKHDANLKIYDVAFEQHMDTVHDLNHTIKRLENSNQNIEAENTKLKQDLEISRVRYHNKYDITMQPRYADVMDFLDNDTTDSNEYTIDYDCTQFSHELIRNAISKGIFACIVNIEIDLEDSPYSGHDIVAFDTVDAGVIYVEPQTDAVVYMSVGMNYWCAFTNGDCGNNIVTGYDSCFGKIR